MNVVLFLNYSDGIFDHCSWRNWSSFLPLKNYHDIYTHNEHYIQVHLKTFEYYKKKSSFVFVPSFKK